MKAVRVIRKDDLLGTDRHVRNDHYETVRFLLDSDGLGLTLTDITLAPREVATYGYEHHIEFAYCVAGRAEIVDHSDGRRQVVEPGTLWIAPKGSRFDFTASEPTRLICVFTPPFNGAESGFAGDQ